MKVNSGELRKLIQDARADGWQVSKTRGTHIKFFKPGAQTIYGSSTPSDWRAVLNMRAQLRRAGGGV